MAYKLRDFGPGEIAALPPTIGLTSRAPTIGAQDVGRPIKGRLGMGTEGSVVGATWAVPVGIGAAAIIAYLLLRRRETAEEAAALGMAGNPGQKRYRVRYANKSACEQAGCTWFKGYRRSIKRRGRKRRREVVRGHCRCS